MKIRILLLIGLLAVRQLEAQVSTNSSTGDQLQQLTVQLQTSPDDAALRGRIIALAQTIVPAPALPDEAERRMARGTEAFKEAKSTADYQDAVKEFKQATLAAPWSGDAYFNLGLAQDKAEDYAGSLASLKLAQLASPDSKDIKDLYYKVEFQRDKAAEQNSAAAKQRADEQAAAAAAEQKIQDYKNNFAWLAGIWNASLTFANGANQQFQVVIAITGNNVSITSPERKDQLLKGTIEGDNYNSIKWMYSDTMTHPNPDCPISVTVKKSANQIYWKYPGGGGGTAWIQNGGADIMLTK